MAVVLMKKATAQLSGEAEEVVIGASGRVLEAVIYDFDGNVQDITGWSARIIGTSDDLPGVSIDVGGEIVSPASGGTFQWTRAGDFLTQIGEKTSARFRCQVKWTDADGLVDYSHVFQITFVVDGTGEDTNMNAAAVQAIIAATPGHPFEFPHAGNLRTAPPVVGVQLIGGARETVFSSPVGTEGVVRNIAWIAAAIEDGTTDSCDTSLLLEVFYDGSATASISVPLFVLAGMEHHDFALPDLFASTPAFELTSGPHRGEAPWAVIFGSSGNWRLPLPYTNGIKIDIVSVGSTALNTVFCNTMYQDELPACWNKAFRLRASRSNETIAAASVLGQAKLTDLTHALAISPTTWPSNVVGRSLIMEGVSYNDLYVVERVSPTVARISSRDTDHALLNERVVVSLHPNHTFLSLPAGTSGYLAMVVGGVANEGDANFVFEGNVRFFLNGEEEPSLEWSSVEDFANGSYYFEQANQAEEGGIMAHDVSGGSKWSIYKVFSKSPVKFSDGIRCTVPQYSQFAPTTFNWTTFYYEDTA